MPKGATTVLKLGGSERRRREPSRGAENAEGGKAWGGSVPLPTTERSENFLLFLSENGEFWCILGGASALYVATAQESEAEEEEGERAVVKDDILH